MTTSSQLDYVSPDAHVAPDHADSPSRELLPHAWRVWLAKAKFLGFNNELLTDELVRHGFSAEVVAAEFDRLAADPCFEAGMAIAGTLQKRNDLLDIYHTLHRQSKRHTECDRRDQIDPADFYEHYYSANRPLIITKATENWPALTKWTPQFFKAMYGDLKIEVQDDRKADPEYEINAYAHKKEMLFGDFVDRIMAAGQSNDLYLVGNNYFLCRDDVRELLDDIPIFPGILDPATLIDRVGLWFGPAGTVTPLHHDMLNVFMAQVHGRKSVKLAPSFEVPLMYNHLGVFSQADLENPDPEKFPHLERASLIEITLEPGDLLFVPVGWWHHVKALDLSITVTFTNFLDGNTYSWDKG